MRRLVSAHAADESLAKLKAGLDSGDEKTRVQAIDAIGALVHRLSMPCPILANLLSDESAAVRAHSANALRHDWSCGVRCRRAVG